MGFPCGSVPRLSEHDLEILAWKTSESPFPGHRTRPKENATFGHWIWFSSHSFTLTIDSKVRLASPAAGPVHAPHAVHTCKSWQGQLPSLGFYGQRTDQGLVIRLRCCARSNFESPQTGNYFGKDFNTVVSYLSLSLTTDFRQGPAGSLSTSILSLCILWFFFFDATPSFPCRSPPLTSIHHRISQDEVLEDVASLPRYPGSLCRQEGMLLHLPHLYFAHPTGNPRCLVPWRPSSVINLEF